MLHFESLKSNVREGYMKRPLVVLVLVSVIAFLPCRSSAEDVGPIFTTPLVGITMGAFAGYLASLFSKHPEDHYNTYASVGAGVGFACGLALGISSVVDARASFYHRDTADEKLYGLNLSILLK
jgi:NhaP-type Na+/H+ or K+/H+ antiporter